MAKHNELGKKGEAIAVDFLLEKGYKILETNWRYSRAEIDLIAMDGEILVFVETKTRSHRNHGDPTDAISPKKRMLMMDAATRYMESIQHEWAIRFDIISVVADDRGAEIIHHIDSFSPYEEQ